LEIQTPIPTPIASTTTIKASFRMSSSQNRNLKSVEVCIPKLEFYPRPRSSFQVQPAAAGEAKAPAKSTSIPLAATNA
jgi:hypothetical protein